MFVLISLFRCSIPLLLSRQKSSGRSGRRRPGQAVKLKFRVLRRTSLVLKSLTPRVFFVQIMRVGLDRKSLLKLLVDC